MFSRKDQLNKKTGIDGVGREAFLKQLTTEFTTTRSYEAKKQTLANLANFAYDPINYEYIKQFHIIDLFLAQLSENAEELIHYALAGLCNICCDPESRDYIITLNGVKLVAQFLCHPNEEIALNSLTTLFYLLQGQGENELSEDLQSKISEYSTHSNPRFRNLGVLFLDTYGLPQAQQ
ncbi:armadillo repeat-containing protein 7 [Dendroctonus ponderosae]